MKLSLKWFLWFGGICCYVLVLGGIFYYNLFKWVFDERLKQDVLEAVRHNAQVILKGLQRNPTSITFDEYDVMDALKSDKRIVDMVYWNKDGTIRWYKQASFIGTQYDDYNKSVGLQTSVLMDAYKSGSVKVSPVPGQPYYDMAIPFRARGGVIGILTLQVSREDSDRIIRSAMRKYIMGALGVMVLLGVPLYIFLLHYVISPLVSLKESIDTISTKSFEMRFMARSDEIGELTESISNFLAKVRVELEAVYEKDRQRQAYEQTWWQSILNTAVSKTSRALVVDEDNNILFANFELRRPDPPQKLHLLDVIDTQQQDVLRLIGNAMDSPRESMEGETVFKGIPYVVKVVQLQAEGNIRRTLILFEPKQGPAVFNA
ncbi:MAG: hypothetical protein GX410_10560 [Elusimicrobia bacterium]|nr:hypothetical protein [Elusimicrobiota bacterium]